MLCSAFHETEHGEFNFHSFRQIHKLNNNICAPAGQIKALSFWNLRFEFSWRGAIWDREGLTCRGFWTIAYSKLKPPSFLHGSIWWQQNKMGVTRVVNCSSSQLSSTARDQSVKPVVLFRNLLTIQKKANTGPWVSSFCGDIPNLSG